jgi:DNA-directed RNA polymerase specialized sigma subunit
MIGRLYLRDKNRHGGDRKSSGNNYQLIPTAEKIANENNISEKTVRNYADDTKYYEKLEIEKPEIADKIWKKEMTISDAKKEEKKEQLEQKKQEYREHRGAGFTLDVSLFNAGVLNAIRGKWWRV